LSTAPEGFYAYPEYLWGANDAVIVSATDSPGFSISWQQGLLFGGMLLAALFFGYKMLQLYRLRRKGKIEYFKDYTRIVLAKSSVAFSFFKSIFLGDRIVKKEHKKIIEHELVHIRQRHTYDLLFFELMRIAGWFNPLVYVYQNRISELHEFIADAQVAKSNKVEQYELLLSQAFQTENISFINQFFNSSLIKKRIVMLTKEKSKKIWKLKYLVLVPMIVGMLFYTACENDASQEAKLEDNGMTIKVGNVENLTKEEENRVYARLKSLSESEKPWELQVTDSETVMSFVDTDKEVFVTGMLNEPVQAQMTINSKEPQRFYKNFVGSKGKPFDWKELYRKENLVPFAYADKVPVFPGCEDDANASDCFQKMMQSHIRKNFRYPDEAQKQGIQGRVGIMFTIDEQGNITNIRKRGPDPLLENEAVRIIEKLPKMKPGEYEGQPVRVPFSIPITFKLEQAGFNPQSQDANYVKLQKEQLSEMSSDIQMKYRNGIPFAKVENAPIFPGCEDAPDPSACFQEKIQSHISKNFRYPQEAQEKGIQGRVSILFLIDSEGNITNIATRGPDKSLEEEALRIISKLPQMKPGSQQGKNVNVPFSIPITFKLQ